MATDPMDSTNAMATAGGEKGLLIPDLRRPPPMKHMSDLEKGIDQESMDTPARQVTAVAEDEEQEHLILKDQRYNQQDMVVHLEKGTEDAMCAPDVQLPAMAAGGEKKEHLMPHLLCLLPAKHMPDLEKGTDQVSMDTHARQISAVAEDEEQEHLILKDQRHHQLVEGGAVAGKMNNPGKKWLAYWLLVAAASVIVLNNHIHTAAKDQLFPPGLAMFIVFLCAICLMLRAMK